MDAGLGDSFVGRDVPQQRIRATIADVLTGRARLVLVSGEAGIGKTSLVAHTLDDTSSAIVGWGTCLDADRAPAYWPWVQALRGLPEAIPEARDLSDPDARELGRLLPELSDGMPLPSEDLQAERARFRLFDAVGRWLERLARVRPIVLVLDDLQWADSSSLGLLDHIVRPHRPVPLLLVGTYRHDELRSETAAALTELATRAENIRLEGLSDQEVHALLAHTAGGERATQWAETVHRRSGGHPFLVRELGHALATHGTPDTIPHAARELIVARIARLPDGCRRMLDAAAVAGDTLLPGVLADVLELPVATVVAAVAEAAQAGVLVAGAGSDRARFAHDLYRQAIAAELTPGSRMELHRRIGEALERRRARGGVVFPADIAWHFANACAIDGPERALRWALEAAAADRDRLAFAEAAAQLARVQAALDAAGVTIPSSMLIDLLVAHADVEARAGNADAARTLLRRARAQANGVGDPQRLAAVALGLQRLGARFAMPRDEIVVALEAARAAVEDRMPALEAQLTASLARELRHSVPTDRARAEPLSERAVAIARDLEDPAALLACLFARHDVLWTPGAAGPRVEVAREIVALAERAADPEQAAEGHLLAANALLESGSPAFRAELDAFLQLEDGFRQPRHDYLAMTRRAAIALLGGRLEDAERLILEAASLGERIGEPDAGNVRVSQLLELARARGAPKQLRATATMAVAWWVGVPSHAHAVAAGLLAEAGDLDAARRAVDTVLELGAWREDRSYLWPVFVGGLTVAAVRLGDRTLTRELLEELEPLADVCGVNGAVVSFAGSLAHWAGVAAKALGEIERAQRFLLQALETHRRIGACAWEAATCAELAELDGRLSDEHRERASQLADELGLVGIRARLAHPEVARDVLAVCRREGDTWQLAFGDRAVRLRDAKGLHDLVALLRRPGEEISVLELIDSALRDTEETPAVLDARARREFRRRIEDLEEDLAEARAQQDLARIERIEELREAVLAELRRATGVLGKDRGLGASTIERARKAVTARLRDTIRRITVELPDLGAHLDRSIRTGTWCRYEPSERVRWDLSAR